MPLVQYTECHNGTQTHQTRFTILCHQLPMTDCYLRHSLSVAHSGSHSGTPFEASFVDFCIYKNLDRTFGNHISKKRACSKFWPHVIRGPLSSREPTHVCTVITGLNPTLCVMCSASCGFKHWQTGPWQSWQCNKMSDCEEWCHTGLITGITIEPFRRVIITAKLHLVIF